MNIQTFLSLLLFLYSFRYPSFLSSPVYNDIFFLVQVTPFLNIQVTPISGCLRFCTMLITLSDGCSRCLCASAPVRSENHPIWVFLCCTYRQKNGCSPQLLCMYFLTISSLCRKRGLSSTITDGAISSPKQVLTCHLTSSQYGWPSIQSLGSWYLGFPPISCAIFHVSQKYSMPVLKGKGEI